jgi:maleylacetate reductase
MTGSESGTFTYSNPPVIHWGPDCVAKRLAGELDRRGWQRAFLVTTRSVGANPALADALAAHLGARLVGRYTGITEHAPVATVTAAVAAARAAEPDVLLSLGGGSPIDAAKTVAFALASDLDLADAAAPAQARRVSLVERPVLPHVAVPTTLSVAELSDAAGFTAAGTLEKTGVGAPALLPAIVFYDAALAVHTPRQLWLASGIRAVDHAVETLYARGSHPYADTLALDGLRRLRAGLLASAEDPAHLAARTACQLGAWFTYTFPAPAMRGLSHTLGKRLGSRHGIPHGVTSCLLLPHVMRYLLPTTAPAQARIAAALGAATDGLSTEQAAARAPDAVSDLIARLGLPQHAVAYGLTEADLEPAARPVASETYPLDDLIGILRAAL